MKTRIATLALLGAALLSSACSTNRPMTPEQAKKQQEIKSQLDEARAVIQERHEREQRLAGSSLERLALFASEAEDEETQDILARLASEDAIYRTKRWLQASFEALHAGKTELFSELASDALEMQLEKASFSGGMTLKDGRELLWRVIPNSDLVGHRNYDDAVRDFPAPPLGVEGEVPERKPWKGFVSGFLAERELLSEDAMVVDGPMATLVVDYQESLKKLEDHRRDEIDPALHYQVSVRLIREKRVAGVFADIPSFYWDEARSKGGALEQAKLDEILADVEKNSNLEFISAPRLTVLPGQLANISITNERSYIKGRTRFSTAIASGPYHYQGLARGKVRTGLALESQVTPIEEGVAFARIGLEFADLALPMANDSGRGGITRQWPQVFSSSESKQGRFEIGKTYFWPNAGKVAKDRGKETEHIEAIHALIEIKEVHGKISE